MNLSKTINGKLLPELRKLGIPCPGETCTIIQPMTEYHQFTFCAVCDVAHFGVDPHFTISPITCIVPTLHYSLTVLNIDTGKITLQLEDPNLFQQILAVITCRWKAMQRYEDIQTLNHIEEHSKSEKALFNQERINRLFYLAGFEPSMNIPWNIPWVRLPYKEAIPYIKEARRRLDLYIPNN